MIRNAVFYSIVMELMQKGKLPTMNAERMKARQNETEIRYQMAQDIKKKAEVRTA
jgi:hypothetical protein